MHCRGDAVRCGVIKEECSFLKKRTNRRNSPGSRRAAKASGGKACLFEKKSSKTFGRFGVGLSA
jgi:hypothetical protein